MVAEVVDEGVASAAGADEGRASIVAVSLDLTPSFVTVVIRDDGTAMSHRDVFGERPGRVGVARLRHQLRKAGGELSFRARRPRGVELIGLVPLTAEGAAR